MTSSDGPSPNSEGWVISEDDFVSVYCVSLPWIGTSILMAPKSTLSDGLLYLVNYLTRKQSYKRNIVLQTTKFHEGAVTEFGP